MPDLINHSFEEMLALAAAALESDMKTPPIEPKPAIQTHPAVTAPDEAPIRPRHRPAVPVLTVLDDGRFDTGQDIRIRTESFTIGRTHGDLLIPNDAMLSGRHAELRLTPHGGGQVWTLHDLESSNRVFVRVQSAVLTPGMVVMLGNRRFQLRRGDDEGSEPGALPAPETMIGMPARPVGPGSHDVLVELPGRPWQPQFPLAAQRMLIGRDANQCHIHIDDPTLAQAHAEMVRQADGWHLRARPSKNGVWVSARMVRLGKHCFFQCGEQRFRFVLP